MGGVSLGFVASMVLALLVCLCFPQTNARVVLIDNGTGRTIFNVSAPRITRFGGGSLQTDTTHKTFFQISFSPVPQLYDVCKSYLTHLFDISISENLSLGEINGTLVLQNSTRGLNATTGSVAFVFPTTGRTWESLILPLYQQGAIAVVVYNRFASMCSLVIFTPFFVTKY
jgi:hypothetical protein